MQVVHDLKSPITCMVLLESNVWVGSSSGVIKVFGVDSKQPVGLWDSNLCILDMVHLPVGYYHKDKEALVILVEPSTIALFTNLDVRAGRMINAILPDRAIQLGGDPICALTVPAVKQLWVCTADGQLNVFSCGCYDDPVEHNNPYGASCMASEEDSVFIASGSEIHKWSQSPSYLTNLDCEETILNKIPNYSGN